MTTVGRLKGGDMLIAGEVNERLPAVRDGLVAHFPFDDTEKGINFKNILDYSHWRTSLGTTGSGNNFSMHGRNVVEMYEGPYQYPDAVVSNTVDDTTSNYEGGWTNYNNSIDNTKLYRLSVWIRREDVGNGRTYFGCQGSTVCNLGTTTVNTNPYFGSRLVSDLPAIENGWTLWVGHIHPHDYTGGTHAESGIYDIHGKKLSGLTDYKWEPGETVGGHRSYLYYSTTVGEKQFWAYPRMEICDGSEPTIEDLIRGINGEGNAANSTFNENTEIYSYGAEVSEATTNLNSTTNLGLGEVHGNNGWYDFEGSGNYEYAHTPFGYRYVAHIEWINNPDKDANNSGGGIEFGRAHGNRFTVSPSTTYTYSYYIKVKEREYFHPNFIYKREYDSAGSQIVAGGTASTSNRVYLGQGWYRIWSTFTTNASTASMNIQHYAYDGNGNEIWFFGGQLEEKGYPTAFTENSRSGEGVVEIETKIGLGDFSITGEFIANGNSDNMPNYRQLFNLIDNASTDAIFRTYNSSPYWDGNAFDGSSHNVHENFNTASGVRVKYIMTRQGNTLIHRMVDENGQDVTWQLPRDPATDTGLANFNFDKFVIKGGWGATHQNVSIYSRVLSSGEIDKFLKNTFSITKEGNILSKIVEKPNGIPNTAAHFPLGVDGEDRYRTIAPSTESNTVYEDGAVWIGDAVTNLYTGEASNLGSGASTVVEDGWQKVTSTTAGHGRRYKVDLVKLTDAKTYTSSATIFNPSSNAITITLDWCDTGATSYTIHPLETRRINVVSSRSTYDSTYRFFDAVISVVGSYWIKAVQVEEGSFPTPFVDGTRNASEIVFSNPIINIESPNWTIFGFYKKYNYPDSSYFLDKQGSYSLRIGNYSTNTFAPYWSGLNPDTGSTGGAARATNPVHAKTPFEWKLFAMVRNGNDVHVYDGMNGALYKGVDDRGVYFDSHTTTGWKLTSSTGFNGYIKSLCFLQSSLSDSEIETIYKTQMRAYKDNRLQIQGQIRERKVL